MSEVRFPVLPTKTQSPTAKLFAGKIVRVVVLSVLVAAMLLSSITWDARDARAAGSGAAGPSTATGPRASSEATGLPEVLKVVAVNLFTVTGGQPEITTKGGKLGLYANVTTSKGTTAPAAQLGVALQWLVDDSSIARVDAQGEITALRDGDVTITAKAIEDGVTSKPLKVHIAGQSDAPHVVSVDILREDGNSLGDSSISLEEHDIFYQFHALVKMSDGTTYNTSKGQKAPNVTWSTNDTSASYINPDTGRFKSIGDGTFVIILSVTGGFDGKTVTDKGFVNVLTGDLVKDKPSNSLKVNVEYEDKRGTIAKTKTYSVAGLSALGTEQHTYTLIRQMTGKFETVNARGVLVTRVLEDMDIDFDKLSGFYVAANDGANPGRISKEYLFQKRYYYPNFDLGGDLRGAQAVPPMLSLVDNYYSDACIQDFDSMGDGRRFRLCFGTSGPTDMNARISIKYIHTMTVLMKGSPPSGGGNPGDPDPGKPNDPDKPKGGLPGAVGSQPGAGGTGGGTGSEGGSGGKNGAKYGTDKSVGLPSGDAGDKGGALNFQREGKFDPLAVTPPPSFADQLMHDRGPLWRAMLGGLIAALVVSVFDLVRSRGKLALPGGLKGSTA